MATKRAKILPDNDLDKLLKSVEFSENRAADRLKITLSYYAGLRVSEIAGMSIDAMLDASGRISPFITVFGDISKYNKERTIPTHPKIKLALQDYLKSQPNAEYIAIGKSGKRMTTNALTVWFFRLYRRCGFNGCSSHSGRRTFITSLARSANRYGNSLRDVQALAGHAQLGTTECYIDRSTSVTALIASLGTDDIASPQSRASKPPEARRRIVKQSQKPGGGT